MRRLPVLAVIAVGDERHRRDLRLEQFAALLELERRCPARRARWRHSPWRSAARAMGEKPPLVTRPTSLPSPSRISAPSRTGWRPSTRRPTRFWTGPFVELAEDPHRAGEAAFGAAALADGESRGPAITGVVVAVEIVAVERQAGLEPQQIARAEADRLDRAGRRRARRRAARRRAAGDRNLEPVLAGIARAADPQRLAVASGTAPPCMKLRLGDARARAARAPRPPRAPAARAAPAPSYGRARCRAAAAARISSMSPCLVAPLTTT